MEKSSWPGTWMVLVLKAGYLVIFDPGDIDWEEKIYWKEEVYKGKTIFMVGL
ncbi:MAG: hypothetical protein JSV88_12220 [Candidatus Aminicenantes bacterium]|nr:MAG: hypothetical protein JSV88_12220 [Candidatus Aminicenantes bacterium]